MNDRFRFRVWDKEKEMMCYEAEQTYDCLWGSIMSDSFGSLLENENYIVEQCTGLKDKKGNLIYEGDIVKIPEDWEEYGMMSGEKREVYFKEGGFRLKPKRYPKSFGYWLEDTKDFEVIGNIHENPELLEGK